MSPQSNQQRSSPHQQLQWPLVFHLEGIDLKMSPIFFCHKITSTSMKTEKMVSQNHVSTRFNWTTWTIRARHCYSLLLVSQKLFTNLSRFEALIASDISFILYAEVPRNRDTPSYHPSKVGMLHEINHPMLAWGTLFYGKPFIFNMIHLTYLLVNIRTHGKAPFWQKQSL